MVGQPLSEQARQAALARAKKAGPLPSSVRRELVRLYQQQSGLTARLVSFDASPSECSGWVLGHLATMLADHLRGRLVTGRGQAVGQAAALLAEVSCLLALDPAGATRLLLSSRTVGAGSRGANRALADLLRVCDLGVLGYPVVAAVFARDLGLADVSAALVSGAALTVEDVSAVARELDAPVLVPLSGADLTKAWLLPLEVLAPENVEALGLDGVRKDALARRAAEVDALDKNPQKG